MLIDITMPITPQMLAEAKKLENKALEGHLGTHFDVMDKEFPLAYTRRKGIVFDVSCVKDRDIAAGDIDLEQVAPEMFVAFFTGFSQPYGTQRYYQAHPQLSVALIQALLEKQVSVIGLDCAGIRRGAEHIPMDQRCADRGVFVIENLRQLPSLLEAGGKFIAHTYPMPLTGVTGLPCRVIAEVMP